jgi:hypothetical protein
VPKQPTVQGRRNNKLNVNIAKIGDEPNEDENGFTNIDCINRVDTGYSRQLHSRRDRQRPHALPAVGFDDLRLPSASGVRDQAVHQGAAFQAGKRVGIDQSARTAAHVAGGRHAAAEPALCRHRGCPEYGVRGQRGDFEPLVSENDARKRATGTRLQIPFKRQGRIARRRIGRGRLKTAFKSRSPPAGSWSDCRLVDERCWQNPTSLIEQADGVPAVDLRGWS